MYTKNMYKALYVCKILHSSLIPRTLDYTDMKRDRYAKYLVVSKSRDRVVTIDLLSKRRGYTFDVPTHVFC